jgi:hypothetical protein
MVAVLVIDQNIVDLVDNPANERLFAITDIVAVLIVHEKMRTWWSQLKSC